MRISLRSAALAVATIGFCAVSQAASASITLNLNASNENYVLYGQGAIAPNQGSFTNQQGNESYNSVTNTTTETLTGTIGSSSDSGLGSGSYSFVTTFTGQTIGSGGAEIQSYSSAPGSDYFYYGAIDPSVTMVLNLTGTLDGNRSYTLYSGGVFNDGFSFGFTSPVCTNAPFCDQNEVGLTPGAAEFSPAAISVTLNNVVPEPATWVLMLIGVGAVGGTLRSRRRMVSIRA